MDEYIDRQTAIDFIDAGHFGNPNEPRWSDNEVVNFLQSRPSADVQPVRRGHWMLYENQNQDDVNNGNYLYVCSNCNYSDIHAKTVEVPFCWHCGARMDGEYEAN